MEKFEIRETVRKKYASVAIGANKCCCGGPSSCCSSSSAVQISEAIGYSQEQMASVPEGANLGLGCGNPVALASLREGETVVDLGINFEGASQGWYVPTYVIKGDPERGIKPSAPDLKSVFDLPRYWEIFRDAENKKFGRLLNGPTGWVAHDINITKLEGYGLDKFYKAFSPGSGTALDTAIVTAYKQGRPILFYYWEPTWLLGRYDMTRLEEPPFDEKLWTPEGKFLCTWLTATTYVVANSKFLDANPSLAAFLKNYSTSLEQNQKALSWLEDNGNDMAKGAVWFLKEYPDTWKGWITGPDRQEIIAKIEKAL